MAQSRNSCRHVVKPFPKAWCAGCSLNGCYPWNRNPLLLCSEMGGFHPAMFQTDANGNEECCLSCVPVTAKSWQAHLKDLQREAQLNEECRERAMRGKVHSSEELPAECLSRKLRRGRSRQKPEKTARI